MINPLKDDTNVNFFFTSDLWIGRNNIIDIFNRPFADVMEMDVTLMENWNTTVTDNDVVFVLGNLIYDTTRLQKTLCELNGTKVLMLSEFDKNVFRADDMYVSELTSIQDIYDLDIGRDKNSSAIYNMFGFLTSDEIINSVIDITYNVHPNIVILKNSIVDFAMYGLTASLYPLLEWNGKEYGSINLHGGIAPSSKNIAVDTRISVRTDYWGFKPVALNEILKIVSQIKTE